MNNIYFREDTCREIYVASGMFRVNKCVTYQEMFKECCKPPLYTLSVFRINNISVRNTSYIYTHLANK